MALRIAPTVHGYGDHGFVATLVGVARAKGVAGYVGGGANRWPAVHGVGEQGVQARAIAEVIGRYVDVPVVSVAPEDAAEHFGWIGPIFALDVPASSALTQDLLGWAPSRPGLIEDWKRDTISALYRRNGTNGMVMMVAPRKRLAFISTFMP